ncbi:LytTR family DNA-binding domain-containing protein [Paragemmobacter ruber]|uniref:HTH LytTR-type domain-containing protein n=1 Tax=Paragemmobacter ruber TaxID=1985673 RepID=A0ABW9YB29_9RHOB|nr:LytTR family DNA-binding domain-containing protein [Rhodobacter ruber]NBE09251.1 hypothetical protein [Rhodobacter ruber]
MLSERLIFHDINEFRKAMRHRYVLAACAGLSVPAIVLLFALDRSQIPIDLYVPCIVVGLVTAQILLMLYVRVSAWSLRRLFPTARILTVWLTPGLALAAAGMLGVVDLVHPIIFAGAHWITLNSHVLPFVSVLFLEVAATLVFRGSMRRALSKLRNGQPIPVVAEAVENPAVVAEQGILPPEGGQPVAGREMVHRSHDNAQGRLLRQAGMKGIPVEDVLRLEASGNYVTVVTVRGRQLVPGPFAAVMAQMPVDKGRQVQRSHWVSRAAVVAVHRKGRDIWLQVTCGAQVPVSAALRSEVLAWLGPLVATAPARHGREHRTAAPLAGNGRLIRDLQGTGR